MPRGRPTPKIFQGSAFLDIGNTMAGMAVPALEKRGTNQNDLSIWNDTNTVPKYSTLSRDGILAVEAYISAKCGTPKRQCALIKVSEELTSSEYRHNTTGQTDLVTYNRNNGVVQVLRKTPSNGTAPWNSFGTSSQEQAASILFAMIPTFIDINPQFSDDIDVMVNWYPTSTAANSVVTFTPEAESALRRLCDAFYYGVKNAHVPITSVDQFGNLPQLDETQLEAHAFDGIILLGDPRYLSENLSANTVNGERLITVAEAMEMFKEDRERNLSLLTPQQREEVPVVDGNIPVPDWCIEAIEVGIATAGKTISFNNIRVEGSTGSGKTFGVTLIAAIRGKPLKRFNLNPDSDKVDLKDEIIPNTESGGGGFVIEEPLPEELDYDPISFYYKVTGIQKDDVSLSECLIAYKKALTSDKAFRHVLSPLMAGLQGPYIVEIQEMSRARQGVLSGLNEVFDDSGIIHLEGAGTQFKRHPDAVVFSTDNIDYPGCKPLSPDVRSRWRLIYSLPPLVEDMVVKMTVNQTGYDNVDHLRRMWNIIQELKNYCSDMHIKDGDIGLRELIDWAAAIKAGLTRLHSFEIAVLTKATAKKEDRTAAYDHVLNSAVVGRFFDSDDAAGNGV